MTPNQDNMAIKFTDISDIEVTWIWNDKWHQYKAILDSLVRGKSGYSARMKFKEIHQEADELEIVIQEQKGQVYFKHSDNDSPETLYPVEVFSSKSDKLILHHAGHDNELIYILIEY